MERGLDEPDARRQARLELGTIHAARERVREERTGFALEQMWRELVQAARVLRRSPGLTVLSITTMGAGIGVSAILFALVNGIVLSPLRYPDADRLVRIFDTNHAMGVERAGIASGNVDDWRRGSVIHGYRRLLHDGAHGERRRRRRSPDDGAGQRRLLCDCGRVACPWPCVRGR